MLVRVNIHNVRAINIHNVHVNMLVFRAKYPHSQINWQPCAIVRYRDT